jgi:hypothetical protein
VKAEVEVERTSTNLVRRPEQEWAGFCCWVLLLACGLLGSRAHAAEVLEVISVHANGLVKHQSRSDRKV